MDETPLSAHEVDHGFRAGIFKAVAKREPLQVLCSDEAYQRYLKRIARAAK